MANVLNRILGHLTPPPAPAHDDVVVSPLDVIGRVALALLVLVGVGMLLWFGRKKGWWWDGGESRPVDERSYAAALDGLDDGGA